METSSYLPSYLHVSRKKRINRSWRKMAKQSSSDSNLSTDSLEADRSKATKPLSKVINANNVYSDDNTDTILVPFYENDVLIQVPKKNTKQNGKKDKSKEKHKKEPHPNYLLNKTQKKGTSYLEMFRKQYKQFSSPRIGPEKQGEECEISSVLPEFGDTERESIGEEVHTPVKDFYNTEPYNEIFYEKFLQQEITSYLDNSLEEAVAFDEELRSKTPEMEDNNLRSISEVTQPHRYSRLTSVQPLVNMKLGGLGPDMEKIKPRLERARSLQRYSEKVRMENRLKIYKRSIQADIEKKAAREPSARRQNSARACKASPEDNLSYLVNKTQEQKVNVIRKVYESKSKSAGVIRIKDGIKGKEVRLKDLTARKPEAKNSQKEKLFQGVRPKKSFEKEEEKELKNIENRLRLKSSARSKGMNTERSKETPPVQISFLVNVGSVRPSSALKSLEEKHRMYQEQVKGFTLDNN